MLRSRTSIRLGKSLVLLAILLVNINNCSILKQDNPDLKAMDLILSGDASMAEADYEQALEYYLLASERQPNNPEIYYKIGLVYGTLHSQEDPDQSIVRGRTDCLSRLEYRDDSNYNNALYYFRQATDRGHLPSRDILRAMHDNIQHRDVKY